MNSRKIKSRLNQQIELVDYEDLYFTKCGDYEFLCISFSCYEIDHPFIPRDIGRIMPLFTTAMMKPSESGGIIYYLGGTAAQYCAAIRLLIYAYAVEGSPVVDALIKTSYDHFSKKHFEKLINDGILNEISFTRPNSTVMENEIIFMDDLGPTLPDILGDLVYDLTGIYRRKVDVIHRYTIRQIYKEGIIPLISFFEDASGMAINGDQIWPHSYSHKKEEDIDEVLEETEE